MKKYMRLIIKVLLTTIVFAFILFLLLMISAIVFQSHIHPDEWVITIYDIILVVFMAIFYGIVVVFQIRKVIMKK